MCLEVVFAASRLTQAACAACTYAGARAQARTHQKRSMPSEAATPRSGGRGPGDLLRSAPAACDSFIPGTVVLGSVSQRDVCLCAFDYRSHECVCKRMLLVIWAYWLVPVAFAVTRAILVEVSIRGAGARGLAQAPRHRVPLPKQFPQRPGRSGHFSCSILVPYPCVHPRVRSSYCNEQAGRASVQIQSCSVAVYEFRLRREWCSRAYSKPDAACVGFSNSRYRSPTVPLSVTPISNSDARKNAYKSTVAESVVETEFTPLVRCEFAESQAAGAAASMNTETCICTYKRRARRSPECLRCKVEHSEFGALSTRAPTKRPLAK